MKKEATTTMVLVRATKVQVTRLMHSTFREGVAAKEVERGSYGEGAQPVQEA